MSISTNDVTRLWRKWNLDELGGLLADFDVLSLGQCKRFRCAVAECSKSGQKQWLISDISIPNLFDWASVSLPHKLNAQPVLVNPDDFGSWLTDREQELSALGSFQITDGSMRNEQSEVGTLSIDYINQTDSEIVRLLDSTLYDALRAGASDIHLESSGSGLTIRYRLDGALVECVSLLGTQVAAQLVSRLKVISDLDISERRIPQDGRFKVSHQGHQVDLRVSVMPSIHGEDVVIRILDKRMLLGNLPELSLDLLGFKQHDLQRLRKIAQAPYGMFLVTGPTGSGKTTSMYTLLQESMKPEEKVVTIEDPVEYKLDGVLQIPVNEKKGLTFSKGLRSILRHDPDKIMIGEIRDAETAQIAVQSALTGHQVFSSIHANNVFDVLGRFLHMGLEPYIFVSALNGVLAQRLIRILCESCAKASNASSLNQDFVKDYSITEMQLAKADLRCAVGCELCRGTGYKGRKVVSELLVMTEEIKSLFIERASISQIRAKAKDTGFRSITEGAIDLCLSGQTTCEEVARVAISQI